MLLLGIDIGTSSVKVAVIDAQTQLCIASTQYPDIETDIISLQKGWAEQSPEMWWSHTKKAILRLHATNKYLPEDITAIGIAYQMHGLVLVDRDKQILRDSIIWCDSRAVDIGNQAFQSIGQTKCLSLLLNSPGNFTASKLFWIKQNEPKLFDRIYKVLLPGDFIGMKLTGECTTTISALSEGVFWDFKHHCLSEDVLDYYGFDKTLFPQIKDVFEGHGTILSSVSTELSLNKRVTVTYKAGDQLNNALSLNVLNPGEVAVNAGTSGVIYGVSEKLVYDETSRINTFAHVNHSDLQNRLGVMVCINGVGILYKWLKSLKGENISYQEMNYLASQIPIGCEGLIVLPFGNGAERILNNKDIGAQVKHLNFNRHHYAHFCRAAQEGIVFAFKYGLDIMRSNGISASIVRAGRSNMFLSKVFRDCFVNTTGLVLELFENDGSVGAAIGAGIGAGVYETPESAIKQLEPLEISEPNHKSEYQEVYQKWLSDLKAYI
ncbi:MAG: carbohydrate kinase [Saprospiraceae bacterium]|nr:carbohydrate kinase [Saprospiraceae bacterium]